MLITPDYDPTGALKGVELLILDAQTVDETKSKVVCPSHGIENHTITLKASAALTGAVQIETSSDPSYTDVWAPLGGGPIDLSTLFAAAGEYSFMFSNVIFTAIRVRISTVVAGGTLSATYLGQ